MTTAITAPFSMMIHRGGTFLVETHDVLDGDPEEREGGEDDACCYIVTNVRYLIHKAREGEGGTESRASYDPLRACWFADNALESITMWWMKTALFVPQPDRREPGTGNVC